MFHIDKIVTALKTDQNMQRTAGAGAAGLAAGMLLGGGGMKKIVQYGALAAIGGLAYNAWQKSRRACYAAPLRSKPRLQARSCPPRPTRQDRMHLARLWCAP